MLDRREDVQHFSPDELRRVNKIRRDFVANVSHELKTPVTSLRLLAETLEETIDEDPVQARLFAAQLRAETERLSNLITDLLDLTRLESEETVWSYRRRTSCERSAASHTNSTSNSLVHGFGMNTALSGMS